MPHLETTPPFERLAPSASDAVSKLNRAIREARDDPETLSAFARALTRELCDWCTIDALDPDGLIDRVAQAHRDPELAQLLEQLGREYPPGTEPKQSVRQVLATGSPLVADGITEETILSGTGDPAFARLMARVGASSVAMLPLSIQGERIGTLTLCLADATSHPYTSIDRSILEDLASTAAHLLSRALSYRRLEQALKERDQFLSIVAHELKTPMTALQSLIQLLLRDGRGGSQAPPLPDEQRVRMLENAEKQSLRIVKLVNDLLDMSRMSAGRFVLKKEPGDLSELVRDLLERLGPQLKASGCEAALEGPVSLYGSWDLPRLEEVLTNLLSNAMKYGRGKPIRIVLEADWQKDGREMVRLSVKDHGQGIAPADLARIFDVFERAAHAHDQLGHGLGLYIARQIIEGHQGSIRVESDVGDGSAFICEFPRN